MITGIYSTINIMYLCDTYTYRCSLCINMTNLYGVYNIYLIRKDNSVLVTFLVLSKALIEHCMNRYVIIFQVLDMVDHENMDTFI